jgi:hypothetical protein
MARKKLERFAENSTFDFVVEPSREEVLQNLNLKGKWKSDFFKTQNLSYWSSVVVRESIPWQWPKNFLKGTF